MTNELWKSPSSVWKALAPEAREHRKQPTAAEARLWQLLRNRQVDGLRFRRQHTVSQFIVDFYCAEAKLVIEVDGAIHDEQKDYDEARTAVIESFGLRVIRFSNEAVLTTPAEVCEAIRVAARLTR